MENQDYKTSESVDMKNPEAIKYAADQVNLSPGVYRACADGAGTYNRQAIEKWISRHYDYEKKRIFK